MRSQVVRYLGFVGLLIAPSSGIWAAEIYSFTSIDVPGATSGTGARGINNAGQIVGEFYASEPHGFLKDGVIFTTIDVPGTLGGQPFGINDAGRIVGTFFDARGNHGFLKDGATFATIDVAGATGTQARGINDFGQIAGSFFDGTGAAGFSRTAQFPRRSMFPARPTPKLSPPQARSTTLGRSWGSSLLLAIRTHTAISRHHFPNPRPSCCTARGWWD